MSVLDESLIKLDYVLGLKIEDFSDIRLLIRGIKLRLAKSRWWWRR